MGVAVLMLGCGGGPIMTSITRRLFLSAGGLALAPGRGGFAPHYPGLGAEFTTPQSRHPHRQDSQKSTYRKLSRHCDKADREWRVDGKPWRFFLAPPFRAWRRSGVTGRIHPNRGGKKLLTVSAIPHTSNRTKRRDIRVHLFSDGKAIEN